VAPTGIWTPPVAGALDGKRLVESASIKGAGQRFLDAKSQEASEQLCRSEADTKAALCDLDWRRVGTIKPGEVRNPTGRNGKLRLDEFREYLSGKAVPSSPQTRRESILVALYTTSIDRRRRDHVAAARVLLSYDLGLPTQAIDISNPDESLKPKTLVVRWVDAKHDDKSEVQVGDGKQSDASNAR
jgi:hypothetical protein